MLTKPTCLHIPSLYEEGTARIVWESTGGADGYELDVHYDEDFETASTGKRWVDIDMAGLNAAEIEALNLTWEMIAKLPAQGLNWKNIEFHNQDWSNIDAGLLSWEDIQKLPLEFTEYKGEGEKTQGPDQGLVWANIKSSGLDWTGIEALCWNWEDFMLQPSTGINWAQIKSENLDWAEIEARGKTWHEFERQAARGLGWGSLDGRFLDWLEIAAKQLTWKQFEYLPPDSKTHIAHNVDIPLYKNKAIFRVRAYKSDEFSDYLTSNLVKITPLFEREDSFAWTTVTDNIYRLEIRGDNIRRFSTVIINLKYANTELSLTNFAVQNQNACTKLCTIEESHLEILSHANGRIQFRCNRAVPVGEEWSGIVTVLEFRALKNGSTEIKLS